MSSNNDIQQKNMSGMSGLPVLIVLGLILGAGYFLLREEINLPFSKPSNTVEVRRLEGFPVNVPLSTELEKIHAVLKSEKELIAFLAAIDKSNTLSVNEKIDFDKEYLIGVSSKAFDTDGHGFKIRKVYINKEKDMLLVSSRTIKPGDSCNVTEGLNTVVDIVAVSKTDQEFDFENLIETQNCSDE